MRGEELRRRETAYRGERPAPNLRGQTVILVDDGLATGSTMRAAVAAVRQQHPAKVVRIVPAEFESAAALYDAPVGQRFRERAIQPLDIKRRGSLAFGDGDERTIERLAQLDRRRQGVGGSGWLALRAQEQGARLCRTDDVALPGPRDQVRVRVKVFVRRRAPVATHRVREIQTRLAPDELESVRRRLHRFGQAQPPKDHLTG